MKYTYDTECRNLAIHFFGERDPRLAEIAQAIQDTVERFPSSPCQHDVLAGFSTITVDADNIAQCHVCGTVWNPPL